MGKRVWGRAYPWKGRRQTVEEVVAARPRIKSVRWEAAEPEAAGLLMMVVRRTLKLRSGCRKPVRRHEELVGATDSLRSETAPYSIRRYPGFRNGTRGSSAQPIHRITHPEGACPSWADLSESNARSYAICPGSGTEPSRFLGTKSWKSLIAEPIIAGPPRRCKSSDSIAYSHVTTRRQEFNRANPRLPCHTLKQVTATVLR